MQICGLEQRRVGGFLPDRESGTAEAYLSAHAEIVVLTRDRSCCYGEVPARALPEAIGVADRWHMMENSSAIFLAVVSKSMTAIRAAVCRHDRPQSADQRRTPAVRGAPSADGDRRSDSDVVATGYADQANCLHDRPQPQAGARHAGQAYR